MRDVRSITAEGVLAKLHPVLLHWVRLQAAPPHRLHRSEPTFTKTKGGWGAWRVAGGQWRTDAMEAEAVEGGI